MKKLGASLASLLGACALSTPAVAQTPSAFIPVTPCRMIDTRKNTAQGYPPPYGTPAFGTVEQRTFTVDGAIAANNPCASALPPGIAAISVNLTAVSPAGAGDLRAGPGSATPVTSVLNFVSSTIANAIVVPVATDQITIKMGAAGANVLMDVNGYYEDATPLNTPGAVVARDGSGNFSAGTVTATFSGDGTSVTNVNAATLQGNAASFFQQRVTGSCPPGSSIASIDASGNVTCQAAGTAAFSGRVNGLTTLLLTPDYGAASGTSTANFTESSVYTLSPNRAGVAQNLVVSITAAPGTGNIRQLSLWVNGTNSGVSCLIVDPATSCDSGAATAAVPAGATLSVLDYLQGLGGASAADAFFGWELK